MNNSDNTVSSLYPNIVRTDITAEGGQHKSVLHLSIYLSLRVLVSVLGIVTNSVTLILLTRLKTRQNGHILMVYLAFTDILICVLVFLDVPVAICDHLFLIYAFHHSLCLIKETTFMIVLGLSLATYTLVSVDRFAFTGAFQRK